MTGQAARRAAVSVERFARNLDDANAPDNDGALRRAVRIADGAPERLETRASVQAIARAIRAAGIPARVSTNAGGFVCNHLYFGALALSGRPRPSDPRSLPASARDARADAGRRERETAHARQSGRRAPGGRVSDGRSPGIERGGVTGALYLGVDGGATRCRARLRDANGQALAEASGAAANIHVDFAGAVAALRAVVDELLAKAGLQDADRGLIAIGLGLAGFKEESDAARVAAAFPGFRLVRAANDATAACIGAHAGADGGLIIAGTGSAAIARVRGKETIIGGRGFALGDDGSGSHIGLDALRAAMRSHDGLGPASALTERHHQPFRR